MRAASTTSGTLDQMYRTLLDEFRQVDQIDRDLRYIMCKVMGMREVEFVAKSHLAPLDESVYFKVQKVVEKRRAGQPLAYIFETQNFYGLDFHVSPHVLIPRPETELLIDAARQYVSQRSPRILDVGTGSGCIAITLKKQFPEAIVDAWELSSAALKVARKNSQSMNVEVTFTECDALSPKSWDENLNKYDLIVSNPPYICPTEKSGMSREVLDHEPALALFAEDRGLVFFQTLAAYGHKVLKAGGTLIGEIGWQQGEEVTQIFQNCGWTIEVNKDYSGHDRFFVAVK